MGLPAVVFAAAEAPPMTPADKTVPTAHMDGTVCPSHLLTNLEEIASRIGDVNAWLEEHRDGALYIDLDKGAILGDALENLTQKTTFMIVFLGQEVEVWSNFLSKCTGLKHVDLNPFSKTTQIPIHFLYGCSRLRSINLSPFSTVTSIGDGFLEGCTDLVSIDLTPLAKVASIGNNFLYGCSGLTSIDLKPLSKGTRVGNNFLYGCSALTTLNL